MLFLLSLFLGVLSVISKILLAFNKRSGWTSGIIIGLLSAVYFYLINLKILSIAELGFFLVMLYGYLAYVTPSRSGKFIINVILSGISLLLCYFLFTDYLTVFETTSALSFIWGGYLLTTAYRKFGWLLFILAHISTSVVSFPAQQTLFATLQIVSALVCVFGLLKDAGIAMGENRL